MIRGEAGRGQLKNKASRACSPPELWRRCIPRAYLHFCPWHLQSSCIEPNPHRQFPQRQSGNPASQPHPALTFPSPSQSVSQPVASPIWARRAHGRAVQCGAGQSAACSGSGNDR